MLFKERMLDSLLQGIGQRLAKKPMTWMSWWRGKKWSSVFLIIPTLSEEYPLWKRDEASLRSLRLFGLEPQALHAELQHYWKRPFWQRWWLSLFTSINNKRKAYAYYQRCLAFAEVQKQHGHTGYIVKSSGQERAVFLELVAWFDRDIKQCEKMLEQHAGDLNWLQSRFKSILNQHEQKTKQRLLKCMDKKLKKLPTVRNRIKKESQELGKLMRDYLLSGSFFPEQTSANNDGVAEPSVVPDSHELVYVGPAAITRNTRTIPPIGIELGNMRVLGDWVSLQRDTITSLLEKERYTEIKILLEQSLDNIRDMITPQIEDYQQLINKARQGKVECEEAIKCSEDLQLRLISVFRNSVLLFHPDKSNGNKDLSRIQTELFTKFNQLSENSRKTLMEGLQTLKNCISKRGSRCLNIWEEMERNNEETRAKVEKAIKDHEKFMAELDAQRAQREQEREQQEQELAQERAQRAQERAQKKVEWDAKIARMKKRIDILSDLWTEDISMHHSEEAMSSQGQERPGSSTRSFARR